MKSLVLFVMLFLSGNLCSAVEIDSNDASANTQSTRIEQNYPNPFNPYTTITYVVEEEMDIKIIVCNLIGQVKANLVNDIKNRGEYSIEFDATNLETGVYYCIFEAHSRVSNKSVQSVKRMTLIK